MSFSVCRFKHHPNSIQLVHVPHSLVHTCMQTHLHTLTYTITKVKHMHVSKINHTQYLTGKVAANSGAGVELIFIGRWSIISINYVTRPGHQEEEEFWSMGVGFTIHTSPKLTKGVREWFCHVHVKFLEPCSTSMQCKDSEYQWLDIRVLWCLEVKLKTTMNTK